MDIMDFRFYKPFVIEVFRIMKNAKFQLKDYTFSFSANGNTSQFQIVEGIRCFYIKSKLDDGHYFYFSNKSNESFYGGKYSADVHSVMYSPSSDGLFSSAGCNDLTSLINTFDHWIANVVNDINQTKELEDIFNSMNGENLEDDIPFTEVEIETIENNFQLAKDNLRNEVELDEECYEKSEEFFTDAITDAKNVGSKNKWKKNVLPKFQSLLKLITSKMGDEGAKRFIDYVIPYLKQIPHYIHQTVMALIDKL